jgi:hypothetical protein
VRVTTAIVIDLEGAERPRISYFSTSPDAYAREIANKTSAVSVALTRQMTVAASMPEDAQPTRAKAS